MSRKIKKKKRQSENNIPEKSDEVKSRTAGGRKKTLIIIIASLLALAITVGLVLVIALNAKFDYIKSDISDYITIDAADYKNYTLEIDFDEVGASDVERKIMNLLYQNRSEDAVDKGAEKFRTPITLGDTVKIYYRGYTVDENGNETDIEGASNMLGGFDTLDVGSLESVPGFEEGLLGAVPWDHQFTPEYDLIKSGTVEPDDVMYISYTVMLPDGTTEKKTNRRIDLSDKNLDGIYGVGFENCFEGIGAPKKEIGVKLSDSFSFPYGDGTAVYCDVTVNCVTRCEGRALVIDARFPADYYEKSLRGLDVRYDVFIKSAVIYDTPEYNEAFITETLGLTAEKLSAYEGDSLIDKHRSYLLIEAKSENEESRKMLSEEAVWEYYRSKTKIKKLPENKLKEIYEESYAETQALYAAYSQYYTDFEEFVRSYYRVSSFVSAEQYLLELSYQILTEKLIFYYIIKEEKLLPSESEFSETYDKFVKEHLDYQVEFIYAEELGALKTEEEKAARIKEIEKAMMDHYGKEYFEELVYFEYALDTVMSYVTIIPK